MVIVLAGPTGSGKSQLAVSLFSNKPTIIINADSQQVYKDIPIGTAQPSPEQLRALEHRLFGFIKTGERLSAGAFVELADQEIARAHSLGKTPVFVGGSGLYIQSLLYGLDDTPMTNEPFRKKMKMEIARTGLKPFYDQIMEKDEDYAKVINPNDPVRIIRWHEIYELSGAKLGELRKVQKKIRFEAQCVYLDLPRTVLYERINERTRAMLASGWIEETKVLRDMGFETWLRELPAIGYRIILDHLDGKIAFAELSEMIAQETRHYAKRQETWFKKMGLTKIPFNGTDHQAMIKSAELALNSIEPGYHRT